MYKAINTQNGEEIISLDPKWTKRIGYLRSLDNRDILGCPQCQQPVRFRAGSLRRWHFAHKHLQNCPLQHESPEILAARAILYEWLVGKFGNAVTLEKSVAGNLLPRPIDCWVEKGVVKIAYWLIDTRIKPQQREELQQGFAQLEGQVNWVFLTTLLHEDQENGHIHLTTTEREFVHVSDYDQLDQDFWCSSGPSLDYLNPESETLTTIRGLKLFHSPQLYAGRKEVHQLSEMLVSPKTGEFVHPGEYERLQEWKRAKAQAEKKLEEEIIRQAAQAEQARIKAEAERQKWTAAFLDFKQEVEQLNKSGQLSAEIVIQESKPYPSEPVSPYPKEAICELCGKRATEWYAFNNVTQTCKCMDCYRQQERKGG